MGHRTSSSVPGVARPIRFEPAVRPARPAPDPAPAPPTQRAYDAAGGVALRR